MQNTKKQFLCFLVIFGFWGVPPLGAIILPYLEAYQGVSPVGPPQVADIHKGCHMSLTALRTG